MRKIEGFYFVTGGGFSMHGDVYDVQKAVQCRLRAVQYRNKTASPREFYEQAVILRNICRGALFIINDRVDIAVAVNADGVHIGQSDLPVKTVRRMLGRRKIIGVSVSTFGQAKEAVDGGADYLGVGPVYATSTKKDAQMPTGTALITKIKADLKIPVAAIGGITLENARDVISAGADSLCAISAVVASRDVAGSIRKFQSFFK